MKPCEQEAGRPTLAISVSGSLSKRSPDVFRAIDALRRPGPDVVSPVISRALDAGGRLVPLGLHGTDDVLEVETTRPVASNLTDCAAAVSTLMAAERRIAEHASA